MLASRIQLSTHQITNYIQNKRFYRFRRGLKYNHFLPCLCEQHIQLSQDTQRCQTCLLREEYPPVPLSTVRYLLYSFNRLPVSLDTVLLEQLVDMTIQSTTTKQLPNNKIIDIQCKTRKEAPASKEGLKSICKRLKNKFTNGVINTPFRFHIHKKQTSRRSGSRRERLLSLRRVPRYHEPPIRYSVKRTISSTSTSSSSSSTVSTVSFSSLLSSQNDYLHRSGRTMATRTTTTTHSTNVLNILFSSSPLITT
ncbi:hypothetical protein, no similarity [Maudiozyma barnettii]|uniref:Uncharacterized protein n=1 Tax=Maudiozyma barnettii TaxID=61262 RepID=A0A8H2VJN1_9SACH|nr:hypothetical protein, no similarity [Kazachstania barnettii]CAB4256606.1 hypothetical protein, no similarity [Kazachstania barnettii]CAD1785209.1 hypothetical protein, no similarity [Kazachstania barnettii]